MHSAVNRQNREGNPPGGWYYDQHVDLKTAFYAYTMGAAYAAHQEKILGSIEPGKKADFVMLDHDPFTTGDASLLDTGILQTWVDGQKVYAIE
jgi:predicted amidohydrolase YtcJ